jgi:hypothetical protein
VFHWHSILGYTIDWGSVPAWFSAILTPLSIFVAYQGFRHNVRQTNAELAKLVTCWYEMGEDNEAHVAIVNRSDKPVHNLSVWASGITYPVRIRRIRRYNTAEPYREAFLAEKSSTACSLARPAEKDWEIYVLFEDDNGNSWTRTLRKRSLREGRFREEPLD